MRQSFIFIAALFFSLISVKINAQESIQQARQLAGNGKFNESIRVYSSLLEKNSNNKEALSGRGFTYSWNHEFEKAITDFNSLMKIDPKNIEAKKGVAYVALWSGDTKKAILNFSELIKAQPRHKEFYIALGQAQMSEGMLAKARHSFEQAIQLDPADKETQQLITAIRSQPTILDIDILGGISSADGKNKAGLRFIQISSQVSKKTQLSAKYDNSLSMDNLGLITNNKTIPYYAGSVFYKWNHQTATKAEAGFRSLSGNGVNESSGESQITLEQIFFLKKNNAIRFGGALISPTIGQSAYLFFAGYHQSVSKRVTAGVNYFYANRNVSNATENRFLADADFHLSKGNTINTGFYFGKSSSDIKSLSGNIYGGFLRGSFPVSNTISIHVGFAAENNFLQHLFNVNTGIRFRLEK